jgi:hypothetical protein
MAAVITAVANGFFAAPAIQYDTARDANREQRRANAVAEANAARQAKLADEAFNRANQKKPDIASIIANNKRMAAGGTLLTGPGGIEPGQFTLGKSTLLGA